MTESSSRMRMTTAVGAVVVWTLLAAVVTPFHAQSAQVTPTGPFAGAFVNHFGLTVSDVDRAAPIYAGLFGVVAPTPREVKILFPEEYTGDREAHPRYVMLQLAGSGMEVMTPMGGPSPWREFYEKYGEGMQHITLTVRNTLEAVAHLKALGGRHELGGLPGVAYAYVNFREQLGFTMELGQAPAPGSPNPAAERPAPPANSLGASPVQHLGIVVPNVERAAALFAKVIGVDVPPVRPSKDARMKTIVFPMNVDIEFIEPVGGASPWRDHLNTYGASIHHVALGVENMQKYSSYLEGKGGRLVSGPTGGSAVFDLRPHYALGIELNPR